MLLSSQVALWVIGAACFFLKKVLWIEKCDISGSAVSICFETVRNDSNRSAAQSSEPVSYISHNAPELIVDNTTWKSRTLSVHIKYTSECYIIVLYLHMHAAC